MRAVLRGRVRGKREWDENENEAESWQVERTALRRPPQAFEKRSRRARRKTPFSPSGMASIAAVAFLARLVAEFPQKIDAVTTDIHPTFVHLREAFGEHEPVGRPAMGPHPFGVACSAKGIVHKRTLLLSREPVSAETAQIRRMPLSNGRMSDGYPW